MADIAAFEARAAEAEQRLASLELKLGIYNLNSTLVHSQAPSSRSRHLSRHLSHCS
jgi:hypothetical protein